jgi:ribosomal protein S18 acetylase RimI-like enzyme
VTATIATTVAPVNGSVVPMRRAQLRRAGKGWRLRPWPNDPTALLLVLIDHSTVPDLDDLAAATDEARRLGATRLRTSALFPSAAQVAFEAGFESIDTLALLRLALDEQLDMRLAAEPPVSTRPLRAWHDRRAAQVDQDAFGTMWGNDTGSLGDVRTATPVHRARYIGSRTRIAGFAISGAGGDSGYVQRLAVARTDRRRGVGHHLVVDAVAWMRDRGLATAHVNTGLGNAPALALYESLGFVRLDDRLTIAERRLT